MKSNVPCPACADPESFLIYSETSKLLHCNDCGMYFVLDIVPNKKLLTTPKNNDWESELRDNYKGNRKVK